MASNIVIKNKALVDVTFSPRSNAANNVTYVASGVSLLDSKRIDLALKDNGPTNRVIGKLTIPTVGANPSTGVNGVLWTEIGSIDLTAVKGATTVAAEDFHALFVNFVASDAVKQMFLAGVRP